MKTTSLQTQLLRTLDVINRSDIPQREAVERHVRALAELLAPHTAPASSRPPERLASMLPRSISSVPTSSYNERRLARKSANRSLKSVAIEAHTTLTTARMYETRRASVRPDKRAVLDGVYARFMPPRELEVHMGDSA